MNSVMVHKVREGEAKTPLLPETLGLLDSVRNRAYELSQWRGGTGGNELSDWLQAEEEIFQVPRMELAENDGEYHLELGIPGFDPKDIRVSALPDAVIVEGETSHRHDGKKGNVRVCEFGERRVFRQIALPEPVDVNQVTATLDKGVLEIRAAKQNRRTAKKAAA